MRLKLLVALGVTAVAAMTAGLMWDQWFTDQSTSAIRLPTGRTPTTSVTAGSDSKRIRDVQEEVRALAHLQSAEPPTPQALRMSADAADAAAQEAAGMAARN